MSHSIRKGRGRNGSPGKGKARAERESEGIAYEAAGFRVESALRLGVVDARNEREAANRARLERRLHAHENALAGACEKRSEPVDLKLKPLTIGE